MYWPVKQQYASQVAPGVKNPPANAGHVRDAGLIPGSGRSPGGGHSNPLQYFTWRIPRTEEPGGPQSMVLQKVGFNRNDLACMQQQVQAWTQ